MATDKSKVATTSPDAQVALGTRDASKDRLSHPHFILEHDPQDRHDMRRELTRPSEARPVVGKRVTHKLAPTSVRHAEARPITRKWLTDDELANRVTRPVT